MSFKILILIACFIACISGHSQNAILTDYTTTIEVKDSKLLISKSKTIQINNKGGEDYCDISIPFSKNNKILKLEAEIQDVKGLAIRKLKKSDCKDVSSISNSSLYEDDFMRKFSLKHNRYPYKIKYSYQYIYKEYIDITNWKPVHDLELPIKKASLTVIIPSDLKYHTVIRNIDTPEETIAENTKTLTWTTSYSGKTRKEIFCGDIEKYLPAVNFIPENFTFIKAGSNNTWEELGNFFFSLSSDMHDLPEHEKEIVINLTKNLDSNFEKIRVLYNYLQNNCRYINISIDNGGLVPYPASYVAKNKYGDCKALSNYMQNLLKICNIDSYYTFIYSGTYPPETNENIVLDEFNHAILCVPFEHDTIWLENTSGIIPMGYLGTHIQNRKALLIKESGSHLANTPKLTANAVLNERKITTTLSNTNVKAHVELTNRGYNYEKTNSFANYLSNDDQDHYISDIVSVKNSSIDNWKILDNCKDSAKNTVQLNLTLPYTTQDYETELFLTSFPLQIPKFESPEKRKFPVEIPYPIYSIDTVIFTIEDSNSFELARYNFDIKSEYGSFKSIAYKQDLQIIQIKKLLVKKGNYSIEQYPEFYNFMNQIYNDNRKLIRIIKNNKI